MKAIKFISGRSYFFALLIIGALAFSVSAQEIDVTNARSADTQSEHGVSYLMGSFNYNVPILAVGPDDGPGRLAVSLSYDSSSDGGFQSNGLQTGWSFSGLPSVSSLVTYPRYDTTTQYGECACYPWYFEDWRYGLFVSSTKGVHVFEVNDGNLEIQDFHNATYDGSTLKWISDNPGSYNYYPYDDSNPYGEFSLETSDGITINFRGRINEDIFQIEKTVYLKYRNGLKVTNEEGGSSSDYSYDAKVYENRTYNSYGYMIFREEKPYSGATQRVCAYNLALVDGSTINDCSLSNRVVTIGYAKENVVSPSYSNNYLLSSVTTPTGSTYNFSYTLYEAIRGDNVDPNSSIGNPDYTQKKKRYHLTCVSEPGTAGCTIANSYDPCDGWRRTYTTISEDKIWSGSRDRVVRQDFADGSFVTFSYDGYNDPCRDVSGVTITRDGSISSTVTTREYNSAIDTGPYSWRLPKTPGHLSSVTDALGHSRHFEWGGRNPDVRYLGRADLLQRSTDPEGNQIVYERDGRGNVTSLRVIAKSGSGQADLVTTAAFPAVCSNPKTCNRPTSVTDPDGNTTYYEYDGATGLITRMTGPSVNGVSPQNRYRYEQHYAWLKSGAGYLQSSDPVWLLASEESCRTSNADANGNCAAGSSDEVVKTYQYEAGSSSKGSNLLLLGIAVTADGQTRRTCYSYDEWGRKISETSPTAGLSVCP